MSECYVKSDSKIMAEGRKDGASNMSKFTQLMLEQILRPREPGFSGNL